jgi:hypothetical protein
MKYIILLQVPERHALVGLYYNWQLIAFLTAESWFQSQGRRCIVYGTWVDFVITKIETVTVFLCVFYLMMSISKII